jgi:hypothetical protein
LFSQPKHEKNAEFPEGWIIGVPAVSGHSAKRSRRKASLRDARKPTQTSHFNAYASSVSGVGTSRASRL